MRNIIVCMLVAVTLIACTKIITPTLHNAEPQLVIQGAVSDAAGPYYVSITNTVSFYAANVLPCVSGAQVTITDMTSGLKDSLTETTTGLCTTHLLTQGIPGHTYALHILLNGNIYTASSTMPQPVPLDSVSFDTYDTTQIRAEASFQDPAGVPNYYKFSLTINGTFDARFQTFSDRLSEGRYIQEKLDSDTSEIKRNDAVTVSLIGIDKGVYTYLNEAEDVAYNNSSLAAPVTPTSNITGGCLGYFSAQTISSKSAVVKF